MTPRSSLQAPARLVVWAFVFCCIGSAAGCDWRTGSNSQVKPSTAASQPASDEVLVKLAALRELIAEQPRAADSAAYAAYLIKDDRGGEIAGLSSAARDGPGPPIVGSLDVYTRKGRTMDRATGRPVKVFQARLTRPPDDEGRAEVVASWQSGRLMTESYHYRLRKDGGGAWVVEGRTREMP